MSTKPEIRVPTCCWQWDAEIFQTKLHDGRVLLWCEVCGTIWRYTLVERRTSKPYWVCTARMQPEARMVGVDGMNGLRDREELERWKAHERMKIYRKPSLEAQRAQEVSHAN